jgi:osmotically-inducible protein OsmY
MMKKFLAVAPTLLAAAVLATSGCATSEREAAERLDFTSQIISQSSDLIAADGELGKFPITVDGFKGAMRLKGKVATEAQKTRAGKIVWAFRGVKSVENHLEVAPGTKAAKR